MVDDNSIRADKYSPEEILKLKEELTNLQGESLYRKTFDLVNEGKLTHDDWQVINYQSIYERLRDSVVDTVKLKTLNARYRIATGIENKDKKEDSAGARSFDEVYDALKEGPRSVMLWILENQHVVTKKEEGSDKEEIYLYGDGFYARGEEVLRSLVYERYIERWKNALEIIEEFWDTVDKSDSDAVAKLANLTAKFEDLLKNGPSKVKIEETLAQLRLQTFREASNFNPPSHIPFRNGLLRLEDWQLVPHTPDLIYLWRVEGALLHDRLHAISLNDCPNYRKFLLGSFEPWDIPMLLQYGGYAFYPSFPRQVVMWIVGRPRVGKGTNARIWRLLNPTGYGAISFEKLMIAENRFAYQGIEGKNLLVDPEVKRTFKKGSRPDYGNFNKLFGGDTVDLEKKGKQPEEYESRAKGLFLANLPLPRIDDEPFLSRVLLVKSRDRVISKEERIENLEDKIVQAERDQIVTLFIRYLRILKNSNWNFISELPTDATMEIWSMFSNAVQFYLEEMIGYQEGAEIRCDDMYDSFREWCQSKGIPVMKPQPFKTSVGYVYTKARRGPKKNRYYVFTNCVFSDEAEIEVGHHLNSQETPNIRALYYKYRGVQLRGSTLNGEKNKNYMTKVNTPMLDTGIFNRESALNAVPEEKEMVSNLDQHSSGSIDESDNKLAESPIPDAISGIKSVTMEEGKGIMDQLLVLGYHVNPGDSGPSINGKMFKIAVTKPVDSANGDRLMRQLKALGFELANTGAIGPLIFMTPLRDNHDNR